MSQDGLLRRDVLSNLRIKLNTVFTPNFQVVGLIIGSLTNQADQRQDSNFVSPQEIWRNRWYL